jgi:FkbM family methyltransferase
MNNKNILVIIILLSLLLIIIRNTELFDFGFQRYINQYHDIYGNIYTFDKKDHISLYISNNQIWEEDICQILANNYIANTDVLDIGANIGLSSIRMNQINPISSGCKFHLFEPQHDVFSILDYNTRSIPRILYNFALSDKEKLLNFSKVLDNVGATEMNTLENNNNIHVLATKLDNITFERPISVVKMDVEGSEADVLIGGQAFFEKYKPTLVIEIWDKKKDIVFPILAKMNYTQIWNKNADYVFTHK